MFANLGLRVHEFPSGRFGYVGSVPSALGEWVPATESDVMGGRATRAADGSLVAIRFPSFATAEEAIAHAHAKGFEPMWQNVKMEKTNG